MRLQPALKGGRSIGPPLVVDGEAENREVSTAATTSITTNISNTCYIYSF